MCPGMDGVMKYLRYFLKVLEHKWWVLVAGRKLGLSVWYLLLHDISKFRPNEFRPYAEYFYGNQDKEAFDIAWNDHQKRNRHHWQYYLLINDQDGVYPLAMPRKYVYEMLADWLGASRAYTGSWDMSEWLTKNFESYLEWMHPSTTELLFDLVIALGYRQSCSPSWKLDLPYPTPKLRTTTQAWKYNKSWKLAYPYRTRNISKTKFGPALDTGHSLYYRNNGEGYDDL